MHSVHQPFKELSSSAENSNLVACKGGSENPSQEQGSVTWARHGQFSWNFYQNTPHPMLFAVVLFIVTQVQSKNRYK